MLVVGGHQAGLNAFDSGLTVLQGRYPMRLRNHAAFHTALQAPVAAAGRATLPVELVGTPTLPLIDGKGKVWYPLSSSRDALWDYTLGAQVIEPYDFAGAVQVAARSFAPDVFIIAGPGGTLGSAVAQALIGINWRGLANKSDFETRQKTDPVILSMGRPRDRELALKGLN